MSKTAAIYVKVDANDKFEAEKVMFELGVTPSAVIQMLYKQIILRQAIPFSVSLPRKPIATGGMTEEEIAELVKEGLDSAKEGTYTLEEMDALLGRKR